MSNEGEPNSPDSDKIKQIIDTLREYPQGIWLRKLSRESNIPLSTLHYYIDNIMKPFVVSQGAKDEEGRYFGLRLLKLREGVRNHLESGKSVEYLLKTKDILTE